jgi:hypothetical protein
MDGQGVRILRSPNNRYRLKKQALSIRVGTGSLPIGKSEKPIEVLVEVCRPLR